MRKTTFALLVAAALIALGCASPGVDDPSLDIPVAPTTPVAPPPAAKAAGLGAGTWEVPGEVKPGTYTTTAVGHCYWARLKDFDGELSSIIANANLDDGQRGRLTVKKTDKGLELSGDCIWARAK